jgi:UDP-N-acetylmuramate dehydrogenase
MTGIPGTVGGWVKMNAGAFGHSISEKITRVKVDARWISKDDCAFSYRHSGISGVIEEVEFENLGVDNESAEDYLNRRKRFPPRTCGSVFKNPPGDFAGRLLEEAGAKSLRVGGAYVWEEHANVIVAGESATSSDILALAGLMREKVRYRFGVELEPEIIGLSF